MTYQEMYEVEDLTAEDLDGFGIEDLELLLKTATEEFEPRVAPCGHTDGTPEDPCP